jgi:hypothetical protein
MSHGELANGTANVAAITSPAWLPGLHDLSTTFAEWLPILGCVGLSLQAVFWLLRIWRTYQAK